MNREEAKSLMHRGIPYPDQLMRIDKIYDDFNEEVEEYVERVKNISDDCVIEIQELKKEFKSRICENCEYYFENEKQCLNEESIAYTSQEAIYYDDGCNKFVRKVSS